MAKKKGAKKPKAQQKKAVARMTRPVAADSRVTRHVNMIMDPCNSMLYPTAYRGKDGFLNRFAAPYNLADATATCAVVAYWPRYNRVFLKGYTTSATAFSLDFYGAGVSYTGPGGAYLGANAAETRPVAACMVGDYTGTELDRQGLIAQGCIPLKCTTGTVSVDALLQLMQRYGRVPDTSVETKWVPSPANEDYQAIPSAGVTIYGDDNIIIHMYVGFAAGKLAATTRIVGIHEWQPFFNLGIAVPTPVSPDPPAGLERVRSALSTAGNWWLEGARTVRAGYDAVTRLRQGAQLLRPLAQLALTAA